MKIGYRRMSGTVNLGETESGTRGAWFEKRHSLLTALTHLGHQVLFYGKIKKGDQSMESFYQYEIDMLLVEFGSSNEQFYEKDLALTYAMSNQYKGPKIFFSDDPDLGFDWTRVERHDEWRAWYNCTRPHAFPKHPPSVPAFDMPFSAFQTSKQARQPTVDRLAYIGRPNGREAVFKEIIAASAPIRVYGRQKEWAALGLLAHEAPGQSERAGFYSRQVGALALADNKHKRIGFRTGRAYHALCAGTPVVAPRDHSTLAWAVTFKEIEELKAIRETLWSQTLEQRQTLVAAQQKTLDVDGKIARETLERSGLV